MKTRMFLITVLCGLLVGCATSRPGLSLAATSSARDYVKTELYFGVSAPDGDIPFEAWQAFVDDYITPRFEEQLTVVEGYSQYWPRKGDFVREKTRIVTILHDNTVSADGSIEYIRKSYKKLFEQERVVRVSIPVVVAFEEKAVPMPDMEQLGVLENERINESSGLAVSLGRPRVFWTHNDSDGRPEFFAFNAEGDHKGTYSVPSASAVDWEDMCSATLDGIACLFFADVGDNDKERNDYTIYVVEEPTAKVSGVPPRAIVEVAQVIPFQYEDGRHNCESISVDPQARMIYLISKSWGWHCNLYALPIPDEPVTEPLPARFVAEIGLPMVVAMDMTRDGTRAMVLTYGDAYEYVRHEGEDWKMAFSRDPRIVPMPKRRQGESICYGPDGLSVYLTSEKVPTPLWEVVLPND